MMGTLYWTETVDGSVISLLETAEKNYAVVKLYKDLHAAAEDGLLQNLIVVEVANELKGLREGYDCQSVTVSFDPKQTFHRFGWTRYAEGNH